MLKQYGLKIMENKYLLLPEDIQVYWLIRPRHDVRPSQAYSISFLSKYSGFSLSSSPSLKLDSTSGQNPQSRNIIVRAIYFQKV